MTRERIPQRADQRARFGTLRDHALEVKELSQWPAALPLYEWLLHHYHYLSYISALGLNLKYLVRDCRARPLSCLLFGSAAWKCDVRDQFIGWSPA